MSSEGRGGVSLMCADPSLHAKLLLLIEVLYLRGPVDWEIDHGNDCDIKYL